MLELKRDDCEDFETQAKLLGLYIDKEVAEIIDMPSPYNTRQVVNLAIN